MNNPFVVEPRGTWMMQHPEPSLYDMLVRYAAVNDVAALHRNAGLKPKLQWLQELGIVHG